VQVAGLHRADPSATLYKDCYLFDYILLFLSTFVNKINSNILAF